MVRTNKTKALLQQHKPVFGTFLFLRDAGVVDIAGLAGFDFAIIDCEHAAKSIETVEHMVRAAEAADITPIVRVSEIEAKMILQVMETGAQGIMLPYVGSGDAAAAAREAALFPPVGMRGTGRVSRGAGYGSHMREIADYQTAANREMLLVGLIEDMEGIERLDDIVERGQFDACLIGRGDLSTNLGVPGDMQHPKLKDVVSQAAAKLQKTSCAAGIGSYNFEDAKSHLAAGFRFIVYGADTYFVYEGMRSTVTTLRAAAK